MTDQTTQFSMPPSTTNSITPNFGMSTPLPNTIPSNNSGTDNSFLSILTHPDTKYVMVGIVLLLVIYYIWLNWDSGFLNPKEKTFTLYFAPWCKWCSEVKPIIQ